MTDDEVTRYLWTIEEPRLWRVRFNVDVSDFNAAFNGMYVRESVRAAVEKERTQPPIVSVPKIG